ncbi:MAG TPA: hypothetical protein DC015_06305 [Aequorivita sp.]|nr:hypothetical protein [Aequorivita sp.]|tara:strand:- start:792 stop:1115 length:324 start_codon:yes stop_codon:yes gene_type:complete
MNIPRIIRVQINVDAIEKKHLYKGKKGTYLNLGLVNTPESEYGQDYMVTQDISKEARDAGERGPILGNGNALFLSDGTPAKKQDSGHSKGADVSSKDDQSSKEDLPF